MVILIWLLLLRLCSFGFFAIGCCFFGFVCFACASLASLAAASLVLLWLRLCLLWLRLLSASLVPPLASSASFACAMAYKLYI